MELVNYNINSFADIISIDLDKDIPISNLTIELEFNNEQELNYKLSLNSNEEKIYEQELNTKIFIKLNLKFIV